MFELTIVSDLDQTERKDRVTITVAAEKKNSPPIANAGGDQSITLPVSIITLNGSKSSDDSGIVNYKWTREGNSLAIGDIISPENSSILQLGNMLAPGRYIFKLTVTDDQGAVGEDVATVLVKPDPNLMNLLDITLAKEFYQLIQSDFDEIIKKISSFLGDEKKLVLQGVSPVAKASAQSILRVFIEDTKLKTTVNGLQMERLFKLTLAKNKNLFGPVDVLDVRTVVCQNNCSGRGHCDEDTRQCICESFWAVDLLSQWQLGGESNCDWSLLYVLVAMVIILIACGLVVWGVKCCICGGNRRRRRRSSAYLKKKQQSQTKKPLRYSLLETNEKRERICE